jgi:hypothetical protein
MRYGKPITEVITQRFSCRTYLEQPIAEEKRQKLAAHAASLSIGPLGTAARLQLIAASEEDRAVLRGLGTYGIIRGATGFLVGAVPDGPKNLEDYGYLLEDLILFATDLGLGTCWLGGTFNRSTFAARMELRPGELMPAVAAVGYVSDKRGFVDRMMRRGAGSSSRLPWEEIFFAGRFGVALTRKQSGAYTVPLEMLRLAPSASNKQPWRVIQDGAAWHFYLQRTPGYRQTHLVQIPDLQRTDMGIALSHFELTAREVGLEGHWALQEPPLEKPNPLTEYSVTWVCRTTST